MGKHLSSRRGVLRLGIGASLAFAGFTAGAAFAQTTVTVDVGTKYQVVQGFGTCTSSGNSVWNPANWSATAGGNLGYVYAKDLGCSILRLYVEPNTLLGVNGVNSLSTVVTFSGTATTDAGKVNLNQSRTQYQDNAAKWLRDNSLEPTSFKIIGAVWSPPHWMKEATGATVTDADGVAKATPFIGNYGNDTVGGKIKTTSYTQFAYFCSAYVQAFKNATGLDIYGWSIQNEASFENPFNSATYNANGDYSRYAPALKAVRDDFARYGWSTRLMGGHIAGVGDTPDNPWALLQQNKMIQAVKGYTTDPNLINSVPIYTHHDYIMNVPKGAVMNKAYLDGKASLPGEAWASWLTNADAPGVRTDNKQIWVSEVSGESANIDGALQIAQRIHDSFVWGNSSAYVYWQLADGSATENGNILLGTNNLSNPNASKKYCAFKHFSRYIRPGAQRVRTSPSAFGGASDLDTSNAVDVSAFFHGANKTLTVVLVNRKTASQSVTLNLTGVSLSTNRFDAWRTSGTEGFASLGQVTVSANKATLTVPAKSIVTLRAATL
jgi:O-glycosyl hydrolase